MQNRGPGQQPGVQPTSHAWRFLASAWGLVDWPVRRPARLPAMGVLAVGAGLPLPLQTAGVDQELEAARRLIDRRGQWVHGRPARLSPGSQTGILNHLTDAPDAS